jgi:hypothetical protein
MSNIASACTYCGSTRVIKSEAGIKCRDGSCEGSRTVMQPGIPCTQCGEKMEYRGLNSWGEPNYKCGDCGYVTTL